MKAADMLKQFNKFLLSSVSPFVFAELSRGEIELENEKRKRAYAAKRTERVALMESAAND